jgi:hypothetical protein
MHYERAPVLQKEGWIAGAACGGFAPAPPGFSALVPLPMWGLLPADMDKGMLQHPLASVEATESALGLLPSMALSSAQFKTDSTAAGKELHLWMGSKSTTLYLGGSVLAEGSRSPQGGTQHAE